MELLQEEINMGRLIKYCTEERAKLFRIVAYIKAGNKIHEFGKSEALATEESYERALRGIKQYDFIIAKYY